MHRKKSPMMSSILKNCPELMMYTSNSRSKLNPLLVIDAQQRKIEKCSQRIRFYLLSAKLLCLTFNSKTLFTYTCAAMTVGRYVGRTSQKLQENSTNTCLNQLRLASKRYSSIKSNGKTTSLPSKCDSSMEKHLPNN